MIDTGLNGKSVIITGANHGIGAAIAIAFACEGARVLINFLRQSSELHGETQANAESATTPGRAYHCREIGQSADWVAKEIRSLGGECMTLEADLSDPNMIPKLFDQVLSLGLFDPESLILIDPEECCRKFGDYPAALKILLIDAFFQPFHGINKAAFFHCHDQIDGVEVYLAVETSCQIGFIIGRGMEVAT